MRHTLRILAKSPGFSLVAILALALGIGANTALFSVTDAVFLRPLPFAQPAQLVRLASTDALHGFDRAPFSLPRFEAVRENQQVFRDLACGIFTAFTLTGRGDPVQVQGFMASQDYLPTLGLQPLFGRNFSAAEDRPGGAPVVLVSYNFWRQTLHADPAALGQSLTIDGQPHTVIGILPPALSSIPFNQVELWTPRPAEVPFLQPSQLEGGGFFFQVIARLKPGVSLAQAQENMNVIAAAYRAAHPSNSDAPSHLDAIPLLDDLVGDQRSTYALLFGAVGCVLLIACANVANLLLARFSARRKELALRLALGATRGHIVRQLLLESTVVALLGGALGVLLARWGVDAFVRLGQNFIPRSQEISVHLPALLFTLALALLTGIGMGLFPALHAARTPSGDALKDAGRGSSGGPAQGRLRSALLVAEIALSLVLLIAASLLLTSFSRLQRVSPGFDPDHVFIGFVNLPPAKYPNATALSNFYLHLQQRLAVLPGAKAVALADSPPLSGNSGPAPIAVVGHPVPPLSERPNALRHLVTPNSFATLRIPLLRGRDFNERDLPGSPETVIINEAFARQFFPGEDPLGRKIITGMAQKTAEIVGVVGDTHTLDLTTPPRAEYFLPALQRGETFTSILVRTEGDPAGFAASVRAALHEVDADQPLIGGQPFAQLIARTFAARRLVMLLLGAFAGLALILAGLGVYSVMAYVVTQRTNEIGIRMALGATPGGVQRLVLKQGLRLVALGVCLGLSGALLLTQFMAKVLFAVQAADPLIYAAAAAFLAVVAALACYFPARRATRVDPLIALRAE
ncbi:ABC transporter permease [Horticoccus luteus]|uniref:ABC transporter permease n=1 Tax=Horticoccus luteus TaxID=2862869 RepID=A0A8F9TZ39_9BACT|nr:ABC transporter permease [Horticoccus luteus]QYM80667.1 ABC transporter permease [Horticoccus luteus]